MCNPIILCFTLKLVSINVNVFFFISQQFIIGNVGRLFFFVSIFNYYSPFKEKKNMKSLVGVFIIGQKSISINLLGISKSM